MEKQDELNARIAAEIMRWRLPEDPDQPRAWLEWSEADLRYVWSGWWAQEPEMDEDDRGESIVRMDYAVVGHSVWRPMTDIVASEEVVKAMFARGYWCEERTPWNGTPDHWTCAETRPQARCLAALAAAAAEVTK